MPVFIHQCNQSVLSAHAMAHRGERWKARLSSPYTGEEAHSQGLAYKPRCAEAGSKDGIKAQDS